MLVLQKCSGVKPLHPEATTVIREGILEALASGWRGGLGSSSGNDGSSKVTLLNSDSKETIRTSMTNGSKSVTPCILPKVGPTNTQLV